MGYVFAVLKEMGLHPSDYDTRSLLTALCHLCPGGDISRVAEADRDWVAHTVEQFRRV